MFSIVVFFIKCFVTIVTHKRFGLLVNSSFMNWNGSLDISKVRTQITLIFCRFVMLSLYMPFEHIRLKRTVVTKITFDMIWFVMHLSYVIIPGSIGMCIFATAPLFIMVLFRDLSEKNGTGQKLANNKNHTILTQSGWFRQFYLWVGHFQLVS